jgi:hypothetical protein
MAAGVGALGKAYAQKVRELRREIEIDASPAAVWGILTDFGAYSDWNLFMLSIEGNPKVGQHLSVRIEPPGARGMTFKPKVLASETDRALRWLGRFLVPGLFDGEHTLEIAPIEERRCRFVQQERFTGVLVGLFKRTLDKTETDFEEMNAALKKRAEATV